jgi:hypothetical protein
MWSPRTGSSRRAVRRRLAAWAALTVGWLLPSVGCQVEYAGMTLPSGKYMHDDVQYFPPGPAFPWANTQAATQRARMQAMGLDTGGVGPLVVPRAEGAISPLQTPYGRPGDVTSSPLSVMPPPGGAPAPPAPDVAPGAGTVPPPAPAGETGVVPPPADAP